MIVRTIEKLPLGSAFSKFLVVCATSERQRNRETLAEKMCRDVPNVGATVAALMHAPEQRGAIGAGTTGSGGGPLAQFGIGAEAFALLQSASILGRLAPFFRRVPFRTKSPRELGSGAGAAWRGEALPRPVTKTSFDNLEQDYFTADALVVLTKELFRFGATSEAALRAVVIAAVARFVDEQLLDPGVSATATHPASLTSGASSITSSGSSAANIVADLDSMLATIQTPGDGLRWVMKPVTFFRIAAKLAGVGLNVTPDSLLGIPCVLGSTSPQRDHVARHGRGRIQQRCRGGRRCLGAGGRRNGR